MIHKSKHRIKTQNRRKLRRRNTKRRRKYKGGDCDGTETTFIDDEAMKTKISEITGTNVDDIYEFENVKQLKDGYNLFIFEQCDHKLPQRAPWKLVAQYTDKFSENLNNFKKNLDITRKNKFNQDYVLFYTEQ